MFTRVCVEVTPPRKSDGNQMEVQTICQHLTGYGKKIPEKHYPFVETVRADPRRMSSMVRRPSLRTLLRNAVQHNHRSSIYSKPPKDKIGPVVRAVIFYLNAEL